MFGGCNSFDVEQPCQQPPIVNNPSASWLHTPPSQMPWRLPVANQPAVMRFTGDSHNDGCVAFGPDVKPLNAESLNVPILKCQSKRKSWDSDIDYITPPSKQLITEEKMAENLNCMHISNSYVSHQIGSNQPMSISLPESSPHITAKPASSSSSSPIIDPSLDAKDRTVSLCEQLRKLISEASVIPSPLLNKVERPSKALVLWQPPGGSIFKSLEKASSSDEDGSKPQPKKETQSKPSTSGHNFPPQSSSGNSWDDLMDNNNSTNAMDLNLFPLVSSSSQLLPSEVPLPDDDFMDLPEDSMMDF